MFEIYTSISGRKKTYIVCKSNWLNAASYLLVKYAKKYFKVKEEKIKHEKAWLLNDELYLSNPHKKGTKKCLVAYLK